MLHSFASFDVILRLSKSSACYVEDLRTVGGPGG